MPKKGKTVFIDGFSSVQAVKRSKPVAAELKVRKSRTTLPALDKDSPKSTAKKTAAGKIARTAIPARFDIVCYECQYRFPVHGRVADTMCPKCHKKLSAGNHVIEGEWSKNIKTLGTVEIKSGAVLSNITVTAREIMLDGDARSAIILPHNKLELKRNALFNVGKTTIQDLLVSKGCVFKTEAPLSCRNLDVYGTLTATVVSVGTVSIYKGGKFNGKIASSRLLLEDGAKLKAFLDIGNRR